MADSEVNTEVAFLIEKVSDRWSDNDHKVFKSVQELSELKTEIECLTKKAEDYLSDSDREIVESVQRLIASQGVRGAIESFAGQTSCPSETLEIWKTWITWDFWDERGHSFDHCMKTTCSVPPTEKDLKMFGLMLLAQDIASKL